MSNNSSRKSGGYNNLITYQLADLIFTVTNQFAARYIEPGSRTRDQMEQAARSGKQNIAEGSIVSTTSPTTEIMLTNVARGSLIELKLDYEDYLTKHGFQLLDKEHPLYQEIKKRGIMTADEFYTFVNAIINDPGWIQLYQQLSEQAVLDPKHATGKPIPMLAWVMAVTISYPLRGVEYMLMKQIESQIRALEGGKDSQGSKESSKH